ncbi:MAG: hypothetical protein ABIL09_28460 [Gemmatimonadota bacterium]
MIQTTDQMPMLVSQERLRILAHRAQERSTDQGDYWDKAAAFLRGLFTRKGLSLREHNWLAQLKADLTEPWE